MMAQIKLLLVIAGMNLCLVIHLMCNINVDQYYIIISYFIIVISYVDT